MTTTANKHGLKAAAGERRTRHAQRTPLPPKAPVDPERKVAVAASTATRKAALAPAVTLDGEGKSSSKARAFAESITSNGWAVNVNMPGSPDHVEVVATRENETICINWLSGVYQDSTYTIADRTIKLRNASAAKQYAGRKPEQAKEELNKVSSNKFFRKRETPEDQLQRRPLPFDPGTALDDDILSLLAGKRIVWQNRFREVPETAFFPARPNPLFTRITEFNGDRIVHFCCPVTGFKSFRLAALLSVSKSTAAAIARETASEARQEAKKGRNK